MNDTIAFSVTLLPIYAQRAQRVGHRHALVSTDESLDALHGYQRTELEKVDIAYVK